MRIALLHGAVVNAGDFLIWERSEKLLRYYYPDSEINSYYRNQPIDDVIDEINEHDIMILAGGPGYNAVFYPDLMPLVPDLNDIKIPIMFLGMGWYGINNDSYTLYNYIFNDEFKELLTRADRDTHILGCRDFYSTRVLNNNGYRNALMTGCPAWYDLEKINQLTYNGNGLNNVKKICISNCQGRDYLKAILKIIAFLREYFGKEVEINYVVHRGIDEEVMDIIGGFLEKQNVNTCDISGSADGFKIYDDCDLHIGFRVHSHIYNLSKRNLSILIEEDSRGMGVNEALGLPRIAPFIQAYHEGRMARIHNEYMIKEIEDYLNELKYHKYKRIENAFVTMRSYFDNMEKQIMSIEKIVKRRRR